MFEGEGQITHREGIGTLKRAEKCPCALVPAMPSAHHAPMNHARRLRIAEAAQRRQSRLAAIDYGRF